MTNKNSNSKSDKDKEQEADDIDELKDFIEKKKNQNNALGKFIEKLNVHIDKKVNK